MVPDAVVGGVGTGGTIGGGPGFRGRNPSCRVVAVEPNESCTLMCGEIGRNLIEGIADGFVPGIFAGTAHASTRWSRSTPRRRSRDARLARESGYSSGPRSGAHSIAARELRAQHGPRHVVTFFCDEGEKYIDDYFLGA